MSHFSEDVHNRNSLRIGEVIPDFVESEYPAFVSFLKAYYEFLEQHDTLPIASTFTLQDGVVSVRAGNSTILGSNTQFGNTSIYANNTQFRVGSDTFRVRSVANNTQLTVYEVPVRSYFANTHKVETNKTTRQASGALRQVLTFHQVEDTLNDFIAYFRETYLKDIPQGLTDTATLLPRILDFYQSRGSQASYEFLFQALYGREIKFSYPRDSVFTTSDNEWVTPTILRLDYANNSVVTGNVELLETREIIGLTSNARATVLQTSIAHEGDRRLVRMFITEPIIPRETGGILLEDGSGQLVITKFGVPPEGLSNIIYEFNLLQDDIRTLTFQSGETISTIPTNDPDAITGNLVGSITGFFIESRGVGYANGDFVYPPTRYADGSTFTGGFGGLGQITGFTDVDLTEIDIDDPGLGYYAGLPLVVDNSGTGGSGLSGYVSAVSPGNILLQADAAAGINNNDILAFTDDVQIEYQASREKIDYYELGVALADVFGGLQLDSSSVADDGDDLTDEETGKQLLQESALTINAVQWSSNTGSAFFGANLATTIVGLTSNLSVLPVFVNGIRTEVGQVFEITVESFGSGYILNLPTIQVETPQIPTSDAAGLDPLTYEEIFGEAFETALVSVDKATGQIGEVQVLKGGSGYSNASFFLSRTAINQLHFITEDGEFIQLEGESTYLMFNAEGTGGYAATTDSLTGNGAKLSLALGAVSRGEPYFRNTRSFASADQYLQDITKYQPFSYVLTVEEDLSRYATALQRLVHPAGGLLLPRQTITSDIDVSSLVNLEGIDFTFLIEEDLSADPPSIKTITMTAPNATLALGILAGAQSMAISAPQITIHLNVNVSENQINASAPDETLVPGAAEVTTNASVITVSNEEETTQLDIPVSAANIEASAPTATVSSTVSLAAGAQVTDITAPDETLVPGTIGVTTDASVITVSNEEETTQLDIPVSAANIEASAPTATASPLGISLAAGAQVTDITAPDVTVDTEVSLSITFDTEITPYESEPVSGYETSAIITVVDFEAPKITLSAPTATV